MGEFADMAIDEGLSIDEYSLNETECDPYYYGSMFAKRSPARKTCKRCGQEGLYWAHDENTGRWYLEEPLHYVYGDLDLVEWVRHKCVLTMKAAFTALKNDPEKDYLRYLSSIPPMTQQEYERRM